MNTEQYTNPANMVVRKIKNKDGTESTYHIKLLPSIVCWRYVEDTLEFLTPILGAWYDGAANMTEDMGTNIGILISSNLKGINLIEMAEVMLQGAVKDGKAFSINDDFHGAEGLRVLKELVVLAYKENCMDFLSGELESMGLNLPSLDDLRPANTMPAASNEQ